MPNDKLLFALFFSLYIFSGMKITISEHIRYERCMLRQVLLDSGRELSQHLLWLGFCLINSRVNYKKFPYTSS